MVHKSLWTLNWIFLKEIISKYLSENRIFMLYKAIHMLDFINVCWTSHQKNHFSFYSVLRVTGAHGNSTSAWTSFLSIKKVLDRCDVQHPSNSPSCFPNSIDDFFSSEAKKESFKTKTCLFVCLALASYLKGKRVWKNHKYISFI